MTGFNFTIEDCKNELEPLTIGGDGMWHAGEEGVQNIWTTRDRKVEFIEYRDKTLTFVKSGMGHPAVYPLADAPFEPPAQAVLMDLDGTSVHSESFWIWVMEQTTARLLGDPSFRFAPGDRMHVMGHSVVEHVQYCIKTFCPHQTVAEGLRHYNDITDHELAEIAEGRGQIDAFQPAPGLKEFLLTLKRHDVKIGLVTSGVYRKAWPEILAVFRQLGLGDPTRFYDSIITAGMSLKKGQTGTLGELCAKPHPWLYAETASVGLHIEPAQRRRVIGIEDSSAGVLAIRLAGFAAVGIGGGNIAQSGVRSLLFAECATLTEALPIILG